MDDVSMGAGTPAKGRFFWEFRDISFAIVYSIS